MSLQILDTTLIDKVEGVAGYTATAGLHDASRLQPTLILGPQRLGSINPRGTSSRRPAACLQRSHTRNPLVGQSLPIGMAYSLGPQRVDR